MPQAPPSPLDRLQSFPQGWLRFVPALDSLLKYSGAAARADLLAGLTVAAVAVPQAIAYALVAGVPPEYGLYCAIVMTLVGALFASSRQLINGPTNPISIAVLSVLAPIALLEDKLQVMVVLTMLIGTFQVAVAVFRLGDITRYISHSVIVGFTVGAALLLIMDQLKHLLGTHYQAPAGEHFVVRFWESLTSGGPLNGAALGVGCCSIALLAGLRWAKKKAGLLLFPELLFTVVLVTAGSWWWGLSIDQVGAIPAKLPALVVPHFDLEQVRHVAPSALAIATLGLLEAIAMSKSLALRSRQQLDLNQICLSEGLANIGSGLVRGLPGSGSLTRSAINVQAGALTQWAGIFAALAVAAIVLLFAPLAQYIPKACLAGILIVTGVRMVEPKQVRYYLRATNFDAGIVLATAFSAVFISIEFCILIGVFLSFMLAVPRAGRMLLTEFSIRKGRVIAEREPDDPECSSLLMFGLEGEMFFGSASTLERHLRTIDERLQHGARVLVLRVKRVRNPDAVCMHLLAEYAARWKEAGKHVIVCGVRDDLFLAMQRTGFDTQPSEVFREQRQRFSSTLMAVQRAYELLGEDNPCPHCRTVRSGGEEYYFMV
jgi:SulP family sulfate permease